MQRVHHASALRYVSARYPGLRHAPLRLALRAGLAARMLLSYVSGRLSAGAQLQQTVADLPQARRRWRRR
jgi:N-acetylglucosaminyl-diphospho-decaprenol L-rhamnosyltransferase